MSVYSERDRKDGYWKIMKVSENLNCFCYQCSLKFSTSETISETVI